MTATLYKVRFGTPGRNRSIIVSAESPESAITLAIDLLAEKGDDREWLEKMAANRHPKLGTCFVEKR